MTTHQNAAAALGRIPLRPRAPFNAVGDTTTCCPGCPHRLQDQPLNALAMITAFTRGHDLSAMSHLAHLGDDELLEVLSRPAEGLVQRREGDRQRYGRRGGAKAGQGQALGLPRVLGLGRGQGEQEAVV